MQDINVEYFSNNYAIKVVEYYIGIVEGNNQIGNCPVMQNLLDYFKDKHISSSELFIVCINFRESLMKIMFDNDLISKELYCDIAYVFNENLKGVLEYYTSVINELIAKKDHYYKLSTTDHLTQLANRQKFDEVFKQELMRKKRYETQLSIALLDIDSFKEVNDTLGHDTGDIVLEKLSKYISGQLRETDLLARWGGEEFIILLSETPYENAMTKVNTICSKIAKFNFKVVDKLTCSFGLTTVSDKDDSISVFKRVDNALYEAKNTGKNKVVGIKA